MKNTLLLLVAFIATPIFLFAQIDSTLFEAIKANNLKKVDSLITTGVDLDATDEHGANALMWACYHADNAMVAMMFDRGAEPPKEGGGIYYEGETGLGTLYKGWYGNLVSIAAGENKVKVLKYLTETKNNNINIQSPHPSNDTFSLWTPLMHACLKESVRTLHEFENVNFQLKNKLEKTAYDLSEDFLIKEFLSSGKSKFIDSLKVIKSVEKEKLNKYYSGEFKNAVVEAKKYLDKVKRNYGEKHALVGSGYSDLGLFYEHLGDKNKSLKYSKKALQIIENRLGENYRYYGLYLGGLAGSYVDLGMYKEALELYLKAKSADRKNLGPQHQYYGLTLNNLAILYIQLEEFEKALPIAIEAQKIIESILPLSHPNYSTGIANIAAIYQNLNQYEKALSLHQKALEIRKNNLGAKHPLYALALHNVGYLYFLTEDYDNAEKFTLEAKRIRANILGDTHLNYGVTLNNLAQIYYKKGQFEKAKNLLVDAQKIYLSVLGEDHIDYGKNLINLGDVTLKMEDSLETLNYYSKAIRNVNFNLKNQYYFLPESIQLKWRNSFAKDRAIINSFFKNLMPVDLFQLNLQMKTSTIYSNRIEDNEGLSEWKKMKKQIGKELSKPISKRNPKLKEWEEKAFALETNLNSSKEIQSINLINIESLKNKLSENELIVDITHFKYFNPDPTDTIFYTASLLRKDVDSIQTILLFTEKELQSAMNSSGNDTGQEYKLVNRGVTVNKKRKGDLSLIWEKLLPYLEGHETIYFSPSGLLSTINLGAIEIEKGVTLSNRYNLKIYNNIKSLLEKENDYKKKDYLLAGGIRYNTFLEQFDKVIESEIDTLEQYLQKDILATRSETRNGWDYLKGTKKEIDKIEKSLLKAGYTNGQKLEQYSATEERVKELLSQESSPRIVHFSTHGFFFPDLKHAPDDNRTAFKSSENPMIRSGLLLTGANHAWKGNVVADDKEDGILTAYEIQNLNLKDTELVVLSACETGLGEINGSEGVFGLQRAFKIAGAKHLIMSLWEVPDKHTQKLMTKFYKKWLQEGMELRNAFYAAQAEMRKRYKDPYLWAGFILVE